MADLLRLIDHPLLATLGWTLTHFVWQGAVLGLIAFFILRVVRPADASTRYLVAACTLAAMLATPIATFLITSGHTASSQRASSRAGTGATVAGAALVTGAIVANVEGNPGAVRALLPASSMPRSADPAPLAPVWLPVVTAVWLAGVSMLSLRMLGGWLLTQTLARRRVAAVSQDVQRAAREMASRLAVRRRFTVLESAAVTVPTLVGWIRPVVLLPTAALAGLSPAQLHAIIAHELAHIRRHDYLINLLQTLVETLLFYHPAVWWVSSELRVEREHCCDDLAVDVCGDRLVYVSALAELTTIERRAFALAATDGSLVTRVRRILGRPGDSRRELPPSWGILVLLIAVGGGAGTYEMSADASRVAEFARAATPQARSAASTGSALTPETTSHASSAEQPAAPPVPPAPPAPPAPAAEPVLAPAFAPFGATAGTPALAPLVAPPPPPVAPAAPGAHLAAPSAHLAAPGAPGPHLAAPSAHLAAPGAPGAPGPHLAAPGAPGAPGPHLAAPSAPGAPAAPAASRQSSGNFVWNNDKERLTVKWSGAFRLSDDERDIAWMEDGARLTIADGWVFADRIEFVGVRGGIERTYYRGGLKKDFDTEGRAFLASTLQRMIRSGMFAAERVARLLKQGGPDAVIAEVDRLQIESGHVKRVYYSELLKQASLSDAQLARLIDRVASGITSDFERRVLLTQMAQSASATDEHRVAVARAAAKLSSDFEQRTVLTAVIGAARPPHAVVAAALEALHTVKSPFERGVVLGEIARKGGVTPETSTRFMELVGTMSSSHEQRKVLAALASGTAMPPAVVVVDGLKAAGTMTSSHEKAETLLLLLGKGGVTDATAASFFAAVDTLSSSYDRFRVLSALLARGKLSDAMLAAVLKSSAGISSSHERARLLLAVLKTNVIAGTNRDAFLAAAEAISSTHEQNEVLAALVRAERR